MCQRTGVCFYLKYAWFTSVYVCVWLEGGGGTACRQKIPQESCEQGMFVILDERDQLRRAQPLQRCSESQPACLKPCKPAPFFDLVGREKQSRDHRHLKDLHTCVSGGGKQSRVVGARYLHASDIACLHAEDLPACLCRCYPGEEMGEAKQKFMQNLHGVGVDWVLDACNLHAHTLHASMQSPA